jgi:alpha-beta hydrolase superfamily lysophospholipase
MIKKVFLALLITLSMLTFGFIFHHQTEQDQMIFKSSPLDKEHIFEVDHPFEEVYLPTIDNNHIHGLWFHENNTKGVVLFFHGRGKNLQFWAHRAYPFIKKGYDVFIIDYRGFGKSSKGFKESWLLEDGEIAYRFLLSHYNENQINVYGHSMGTSIATWVASNHSPRMLVLEAPFFNMIEAAAFTKPFIPEFLIRLILKYHLRTDAWIKKVDAPIYIFHGTSDKVVPYEHSKKLYEKIKENKKNEFITLPKAGHGDIHHDPIYIEKLDELLP